MKLIFAEIVSFTIASLSLAGDASAALCVFEPCGGVPHTAPSPAVDTGLAAFVMVAGAAFMARRKRH